MCIIAIDLIITKIIKILIEKTMKDLIVTKIIGITIEIMRDLIINDNGNNNERFDNYKNISD